MASMQADFVSIYNNHENKFASKYILYTTPCSFLFKKKVREAGIMMAKMMGQHLEAKVDQNHKI